MTFLTAPDHTALRLNLNRVVDMYLLAEISPADAVADVLRLCHADGNVAEDQGLDTYVARTLTLIDKGEVTATWAIDHLVDLATVKDPKHVVRAEIA